jgi:hypothetical protein
MTMALEKYIEANKGKYYSFKKLIKTISLRFFCLILINTTENIYVVIINIVDLSTFDFILQQVSYF